MWLGKRGERQVMFLCVMAVSVDAFAQQPKEFRITANEFSFKPSKIQVPQGQVKIIMAAMHFITNCSTNHKHKTRLNSSPGQGLAAENPWQSNRGLVSLRRLAWGRY